VGYYPPVTEQPRTSPTKDELLGALRSSGELVVQRVRELDPTKLEEGRYESGWNGRQILAHIASIEWTYPRILDLPEAGAEPKEAREPAGSHAATSSNPMDGYNERQVAKRAEATVAELLAEFEQNRAATIAAVEAADAAVLSRRVLSAGGRTGTIAQVMQDVCVGHVLIHLEDLSRA
jgi:hypothetical protein